MAVVECSCARSSRMSRLWASTSAMNSGLFRTSRKSSHGISPNPSGSYCQAHRMNQKLCTKKFGHHFLNEREHLGDQSTDGHFMRVILLRLTAGHTNRGADKSLARHNSQCRKTEWIVSLEANLLLRSKNICLLQTVKYL